MDRSKDISIGEDEWIEWKDFDEKSVQPLEIDDLLRPTFGFWKRLETECVAECCGIDAFTFWPEDIEQAAKNTCKVTLTEDLIKIKLTLITLSDSVISSDFLNQLIAKEVFLELVDHIIKNINKQHITTE